MKKVRVSLKDRSYSIVIGRGVLKRLPAMLRSLLDTKRVLLVSSRNIFRIYGRRVTQLARQGGFQVTPLLLAEGERAKSKEALFKIYSAALKAGLDRTSGMIALGGGAIGDVAGFAASTYLREISFVNIPTTLLAQVDSAIGGKTAINLKEGKNLVGTFYQPRLVLSDIELIRSLPEREYRSSLAEIVKYGVIASPQLFRYLEKNTAKLLRRDMKVLERVVQESARIKAKVVERDERELKGLRATLNFGHTFAHAYEKAAGFRKLLHGEAVAMGMCMATRLSQKMGLLSFREKMRIEILIMRLGLPTSPGTFRFNKRTILKAIEKDKKKKGDKVHFILAERIGRVRQVSLSPKDVLKN